MLCKNCEKLALFPQHHGCCNCPRFCNYREEKWCNYCSNIKNICSVCGRPIKRDESVSKELEEQIKKVHPNFHGSGCRHCGGSR